MLIASTRSQAQEPVYDIDIPQLNAADALNELAQQTGAVMLFPFDLAADRQASPVVGSFTLTGALEVLLRGSGLSGGLTDRRVLQIYVDQSESSAELPTNQMEREKEMAINDGTEVRTGFWRRLAVSLGVAATVTGGVTPGQAQDAAGGAAPILEEIVVTATKRESSLQDTPIAVTALTGDQLVSFNVQSAEDMISSVIGLEGTINSGNLLIGIRGVSSNNIFINGDPAVAFHVDGVFRGRQTGGLALFHDLERVEVLKGPQGTLYGRNSTGGTINVITAKPEQQFSADVELLVGNYDRSSVRGFVNTPVSDNVAIRASWFTERRDGYFDNGPAIAKPYGDSDESSFRLHTLITPSDELSILLTADYQDRGGVGAGTNVLSGPDAVLETDLEPDPYFIPLNRQGFRDDRFVTAKAEVDYAFDAGDLTYIGAYYDSDVDFGIDFDRSDVATDPLDIRVASEQLTHEVRFASAAGGNFDWLGGLFYFDEDALRQTYLEIARIDLISRYNAPDYNVKSLALFGQGTYHISENLRITGGIRYTDDEKSENGTTSTRTQGGVQTIVSASDSASWNSTDWTLGIDGNPVEDTLLYAKMSTAYKAGGFNDPLSGLAEPIFAPEDMEAIQIGHKSRFLDDRLQLNSELFFYDYTNLQVNQIENTINVTRNAAEAELKGLDSELILLPTDELELTLGVGYLDATYSQFLQFNPLSGNLEDLSGAQFSRAPKWSVNAGLEYVFTLANGWQIIPRLRTAYRDDIKLLVFDDLGSLQPSRTITDASVEFISSNGRTRVQVFANNLEDNAIWTGSGVNGRGQRTLTGRPPMLYGVSLKYSFGEL